MKGFETKMQMLCTVWCALALIIAGAATVLVHVAFGVLIDPLVMLPDNLETGLQNTFHFATLEQDITVVKNEAESGLAKCNIPTATCGNPAVVNFNRDVQQELNTIIAKFDTALNTVDKVANDPYLGIGEFGTLGSDLNTIKQKMTDLQNSKSGSGETPCSAIAQSFCQIRTEAQSIINTMADINKGIDDITENESIKTYKKESERFQKSLHGLPYLFWVAISIYICFWFTAKPSCCKGGGVLGCGLCTCHSFFFIISFVFSFIFFALGIVVVRAVEDVTLGDPFSGNPSLKTIIDHIETNFPDFYNVVLRDLIDGMAKTYSAYLVFTVAHIMILCHTCSCCCGLYVREDKASS